MRASAKVLEKRNNSFSEVSILPSIIDNTKSKERIKKVELNTKLINLELTDDKISENKNDTRINISNKNNEKRKSININTSKIMI